MGVWKRKTLRLAAFSARPSNPLPGTECMFADLGAWMRWNGSLWVPAGGGALVSAQFGIGLGRPSSGTIGANGALTLTTALPRVVSEMYWHFPANVMYSGSAAGLYYTVMSSTTQGTVYNNRYTGGIPATPAVLTPIVGAGPGTYTPVSGSEIALYTNTLPGGLIGPSGEMRSTLMAEYPGNTDSKSLLERINGVLFGSIVQTSLTVTGSRSYWATIARNSQQKNLSTGLVGFGNVNNAALVITNVDLSVDQQYVIYCNVSTSTSWVFISHFTQEIWPA